MRSCSRQKEFFMNNAVSGQLCQPLLEAAMHSNAERRSPTFHSQVCTTACRASGIADLARINAALRCVDRVEL